MTIEVRPLDERVSAPIRAELDRILLACRASLVDEDEHLAGVEERIGEADGDAERVLLYATIAAKPVGLIDAVLFRPDSAAVTIAQLAVDPKKRRLGVGRALVARVQGRAKAEDLTSLVAAVKARANEAAAFWRGLGLELEATSGAVRVFRKDD